MLLIFGFDFLVCCYDVRGKVTGDRATCRSHFCCVLSLSELVGARRVLLTARVEITKEIESEVYRACRCFVVSIDVLRLLIYRLLHCDMKD